MAAAVTLLAAGAPAPRRRPDRLRGDGAVLAGAGRAATFRAAAPCRCAAAPWCVLLEKSGQRVGGARARAVRAAAGNGAGARLRRAMRSSPRTSTQANALWHIRETIPLAQAEEGLNIKHDISVPVSAHPRVLSPRPTRRCGGDPRRAAGQLRPPRRRQPALQRAGAARAATRPASSRELEERVNTLVYDAVPRFGGSISAEHGIGSLKLRRARTSTSRRWRWR